MDIYTRYSLYAKPDIYTRYSLYTKLDIYTRYPIYKTGYIYTCKDTSRTRVRRTLSPVTLVVAI